MTTPHDSTMSAWRHCVRPGPWHEVWQSCTSSLGWGPEHRVFVIVESVNECRLSDQTVAEVTAPQRAFEGRCFDAHAEMRWVQDADGVSVHAWLVGEGAGPAECTPLGEVRKVPRECVLLRPGDHRYRNASLRYPETVRKSGGYPILDVVEYWRANPKVPEGLGAAAVARRLAEPLVVEHRFVMPHRPAD